MNLSILIVEETIKETVKNMVRVVETKNKYKYMSIADIADYIGIDVDFVREVVKEMEGSKENDPVVLNLRSLNMYDFIEGRITTKDFLKNVNSTNLNQISMKTQKISHLITGSFIEQKSIETMEDYYNVLIKTPEVHTTVLFDFLRIYLKNLSIINR